MTIRVHGHSMSGIYEDGDALQASSSALIERGSDIAISVGQDIFIKRVFGVPGDHFGISEDRLRINGEIALRTTGEAFHVRSEHKRLLSLYITDYHGRIPSRCYLVLGNTQDSLDSRKYGLVHEDDVVGVINSSCTNAESKHC